MILKLLVKHKYYKDLYILFFLLLMLFSLFILVSCNQNNNLTGEDVINFTDSLGREVKIHQKPKRVASLLGSLGDIWCLSGGTLCACSEDGWEDYHLDLQDAVNIGGAHSPNLELLISSNPDFVLASSSTASNVEMKESLELMGITVAFFDIDNFIDYLDMLNICTNINDRKDLFEINGLSLKEEIDQIKENYVNENNPVHKKKILLLRATSTTLKAKGSTGTILGEMLKDMGCINIADNNDNILENLSIESIISENPYHIFVVTMGNNNKLAEESILKMISESQAWSSLDAIINNRFHIMDKKLFNLKPNKKWTESYEILYKKLTN